MSGSIPESITVRRCARRLTSLQDSLSCSLLLSLLDGATQDQETSVIVVDHAYLAHPGRSWWTVMILVSVRMRRRAD